MSITAKALWYVESHLRGDLSLDAVAQSVGVSRYHLSRAFGSSVPCGLAGYVRGRRLSEAAKTLQAGSPDILAVALDAGYGSHEAFTRAFRQHFGLSPEQARAQPSEQLENFSAPLRMHPENEMTVAPARFTANPAILIFGLGQHYDGQNTAGIASQWERFTPHIGNIPGQVNGSVYGVICNADDANSFDYLCGVEVKEFAARPAEFVRLRIPPQTYAVFRHSSHISEICATCTAIWNQGLPDSGRRPADGPWFERYGAEFDPRTGRGGLEIWVPVE